MIPYDNIDVVLQHEMVDSWIRLRETKKPREAKKNLQLTLLKQRTVFAEMLITRKFILGTLKTMMIMVIIIIMITMIIIIIIAVVVMILVAKVITMIKVIIKVMIIIITKKKYINKF